MSPELDEKLVKAFPLLYADRQASMQSTAMCWGFECGDGWFDLIWNLSSNLEPLIAAFIQQNPDLMCGNCGCPRGKHLGSATKNPGRCLGIRVDPTSEEVPPGNYRVCGCDAYISSHPRASQVKEKFGGLRFYMTGVTDEINNLIEAAEELSLQTCEQCGQPGSNSAVNGWYRTTCESCLKE